MSEEDIRIMPMCSFRILSALALIIVFISIAQLCNKEQYGYKSLNDIDSKISTENFRTIIKKRIKFSKNVNYINLIFNCIIYFYYNIRINPEKHISFSVFLFFNLTIFLIILTGFILNCITIRNFRSLSYQDDYFIKVKENEINNLDKISDINDITPMKQNTMSKELFNGIKDYGNQNLSLDATILSFNIFQLLLILSTLGWGGAASSQNSECPIDCGDCMSLFFTSEIESDRKNSPSINQLSEEKSQISKENEKLKEKNEKLLKKIKNLENKNNEYKKIERNMFFIKYYIKQKYETELSSELMIDNFIKDINLKFKENIELKNIKDIVIIYIKDKLIENLTCPITQDIFLNPYIAPEGQTFDKTKIKQIVKNKKVNPLTNSSLTYKQLIPNRKVLDLVEFYKNNKDKFDDKACLILKNFLQNAEGKYYENPIVLSSGEKIGTTVEGNNDKGYKNLIIKSLTDQLGEILDDYFPRNSNKIRKVNFIEKSDRQNSVKSFNSELTG